jgi:hypothetical protein
MAAVYLWICMIPLVKTGNSCVENWGADGWTQRQNSSPVTVLVQLLGYQSIKCQGESTAVAHSLYHNGLHMEDLL